MTAIAPKLYLLQSQYFREASPEEVRIVGIVVGAIILIALIRRLIKGKTYTKSPSGATVRRFSSFNFHRLASSYSLNKWQSRLLEHIFRTNAVSDPEKVMRDSDLLDKYFLSTYQSIKRSNKPEEETRQRLAQLFALRNAIEAIPVHSGSITSTRKVPENTPAVLSVDKFSYNVVVISSRGDSLIIEAPKNALGSQIRMNNGTKVKVSFINKFATGLFFESRILRSVSTHSGPGLELAHSEKLIPMAQRYFRRRQIHENCTFYLVLLDDTGPNRKKPKLVLDKKHFTGTVLDISAGGCSIKTNAPIHIDMRLKIEMFINDKITVLGQVLRTNRSASGTIIHAKFFKVPQRSYNNINAHVYEYDD